MKTKAQLQTELQTLHNDYVANPLPRGAAYNAFAKKYKALTSKIKNYDNATNIMKRDGLKVTKSFSGYKVTFKGNQYDVFLDGCVTDYWAIYTDHGQELEFDTYETKGDAIWAIYQQLN